MVQIHHPWVSIPAEIPDEWLALIASWRRALRAENRTPETIKRYAFVAGEFARFLVWRDLPTTPADIRREHCQAYIAYLLDHLKANTVGVRYDILHVCFSWLQTEDEIEHHPMERMRKPKYEPEPQNVLSEDNIRALLATCAGKSFQQRRDTAIIRLLLDTGMRCAELTNIALGDLSLDDQEVKVLGKGRRYRISSFGAKATKAIDSYLRVRARHPYASDPNLFLGKQGAFGTRGMRHMMVRRAEEAGIPEHLHPHLFRHTFADQSIARGKSESYVMEQGGWRSETVMRRYGAGNRARRARKSFKEESIGDAF